MVHGASILFSAWVVAGAPAGGQPLDGGRLRVVCPILKLAAEEAFNQSETFRHVIHALDNTRVIVYVSSGTCTGGVPGCTILTPGAGGIRYIRIKIDRFQLPRWDVPCVLAHELQHAAEIAADPTVVDDESLRALYRRTGWSGGRDFETEAAKRVQRQVRADLLLTVR